jgi:cytochrome c oxidase subunit IV
MYIAGFYLHIQTVTGLISGVSLPPLCSLLLESLVPVLVHHTFGLRVLDFQVHTQLLPTSLPTSGLFSDCPYRS